MHFNSKLIESNKLSSFHCQILDPYMLTNESQNDDSQILWGNEHFSIKINKVKQVLFFNNWIDAGIVYVKNLKFLNGKLDGDYIFNKVKKKKNILIEITQVRKVIDATTIALYQNIADSKSMDQETPDINEINKTKYFYKKLIDKISTPMNIEKWENLMSVYLNLEERQNRFFLKIKMFDNKLAEFNYKVYKE